VLIAHLFLQHVPQSILDVDDMLAVEQRHVDNYQYAVHTTIKSHLNATYYIQSRHSHTLGQNYAPNDYCLTASFPEQHQKLGKPFWNLMKQVVRVAMALAGPYENHLHCTPDNHTSTSSLNFYRLDALLDIQPTVSKAALKAQNRTEPQ